MACTRKFQISDIFYAFAMAMCCLRQIEVVCQDDLLSCLGRCNQTRAVPCSCDVTCAVLNKCCEDFADHCPHVLTKAMEKFPHLMNATIVCTVENLLMITSCPHKPEFSQVGEKYNKFDDNQSLDLLDIINKAPVGDLSTGFIFLNSEIYFCNGGEASHMATLSKSIVTKLASREGTPTSYLEVKEVLDLRKVYYYKISDELFPFLMNSACTDDSIKTCQDGKVNVTADTKDKCENGTFSYVGYKEDTFKNKHCLVCNAGQNAEFQVPTEWRPGITNFGPSVTSSLTNAGSTLSLVVNGLASRWRVVECDLSENEESLESRSCYAKQCGHRYEVRPDGTCNWLRNVMIGISDDGYDLNEVEEIHLSDFISCFLREHLDMDVDYVDPEISHGCDNRLKRAVYFVTGRVAVPLDRYVFQNLSKTIEFVAMVKTFVRYRKERHWNDPHSACEVQANSDGRDEDGDITSACTSKDQTSFQSFTSLLFWHDYEHELENPARRGAIVDNTLTTVCFFDYKQVIKISDAQCWEEPLYENDLNLISEYMNSSCFSVFEISRSGANVPGVSLWVLGGWLSFSWLFVATAMVIFLY